MQKQETRSKTNKQTEKRSGAEHGVCGLENNEVQVTKQVTASYFTF